MPGIADQCIFSRTQFDILVDRETRWRLVTGDPAGHGRRRRQGSLEQAGWKAVNRFTQVFEEFFGFGLCPRIDY